MPAALLPTLLSSRLCGAAFWVRHNLAMPAFLDVTAVNLPPLDAVEANEKVILNPPRNRVCLGASVS